MISIDLTLLGAVELGYFSRNHFFLAEITNFGPIFGLGGFFFFNVWTYERYSTLIGEANDRFWGLRK